MKRRLLMMLLAAVLAVPLVDAKIQQLESSTWHASPAASAKQQVPSRQEISVASSMRLLRRHPAVHTLQDLGVWSTQHFGRLPWAVAASAAAATVPEGAGTARKLAAAAWAALKATVPHGGAPAVLLQHWWRLRCTDEEALDLPTASAAETAAAAATAESRGPNFPAEFSNSTTSSSARCPGVVGNMELRGLGTATVSLDWVYHHTLTPRLPASTTEVKITEHGQHKRTRSWTLQQSAVTPGIPSGWHIEARGLSSGRQYTLTSQHQLSPSSHSLDASLCSSRPQALKPGTLWSVITASEPYQDMDLYAQLVAQHTDYHQHLGFTGAILMVTRPIAAQLLSHPAMQPGLQAGSYFIILWDGDVVPGTPYYHQSLWHNLVLLATWGIPDIKLAFIDLDEFYVLPRHKSFQDAFSSTGCLSGLSQARIMRLSAYYGLTAAQAAACPDTQFFHKACQPQHKAGDVVDLARMGWRRFFRQPLQYIDARFTIPESPKQLPHRWAHKSVVDPNYVSAYSIHEGGLLLPGGGADSQHGVALDCALGLHLVNMMTPRMYGTGDELHLNGTRFDMTAYVQALSGAEGLGTMQ